MECSCGGYTVDREAVSSKHKALLKFKECFACKLIGSDKLYINGTLISDGYKARQLFNDTVGK